MIFVKAIIPGNDPLIGPRIHGTVEGNDLGAYRQTQRYLDRPQAIFIGFSEFTLMLGHQNEPR